MKEIERCEVFLNWIKARGYYVVHAVSDWPEDDEPVSAERFAEIITDFCKEQGII